MNNKHNKGDKTVNPNSAELDKPSEDWYTVYMGMIAADKSPALPRKRDMN